MTDQATQLRRLAAQVDLSDETPKQSHQQPHVIAVTAGKGGVGTTTVAMGLATALASAGHETVLADANVNNPDILTACGLALSQHQPAESRAGRIATSAWGPTGLHVVTNDWTALHTHSHHANPTGAILTGIRHSTSDIVVVDAGSGLSRDVRDAWQAADQVVLVTGTEVIAAMDAYAAIKLMTVDCDVPVSTVVNGADSLQTAGAIHSRIARACHRFLGQELQSGGFVPRDRQLARRAAGLRAGWAGEDIGEASSAFLRLAHHVTSIANQQQTPRSQRMAASA